MDVHYKSQVQSVPPAAHSAAQVHFAARLSFETDPADLHFDMTHGLADFVVVDVRSASDYGEAHIPGAVNIPYAQITRTRIKDDFSPDTLFIVYCWGPGCNGSTKAALRLSQLGYAVKELIGGIEYWRREGYEIEKSG